MRGRHPLRTDEFWSTVGEHNITAVCLLAAMVPFLLNLPEFEGEQDHSLRTTVIVPWTEEAMGVTKRYNLDALTTFNMTEVSSPSSDLHPNIPAVRQSATGHREQIGRRQ